MYTFDISICVPVVYSHCLVQNVYIFACSVVAFPGAKCSFLGILGISEFKVVCAVDEPSFILKRPDCVHQYKDTILFVGRVDKPYGFFYPQRQLKESTIGEYYWLVLLRV